LNKKYLENKHENQWEARDWKLWEEREHL